MAHKAMGANSPTCDLLVVPCRNMFWSLRHSWRARCKNIFAQSTRMLSLEGPSREGLLLATRPPQCRPRGGGGCRPGKEPGGEGMPAAIAAGGGGGRRMLHYQQRGPWGIGVEHLLKSPLPPRGLGSLVFTLSMFERLVVARGRPNRPPSRRSERQCG